MASKKTEDKEKDDEKLPSEPAPPWKSGAETGDDDEHDDDDDDDEPDDDEPDDEPDDDDDDEPDDEPPPRRRAPASRLKSRAGSARAKIPPRRPSEPVDDGLPDWLPWAVLIVLLAAGALGAAGVLTPKRSATGTAADMPKVPPSDESAGRDSVTIGAQHLLVQYKGAARAPANVTRTKEEAKKRAEEALAKAKGGGDFDALVAEYSDEPGAAARKGNLGKFTRDRMVEPFSKAAFALKPGELSGLVETPFGFHVIKRTE